MAPGRQETPATDRLDFTTARLTEIAEKLKAIPDPGVFLEGLFAFSPVGFQIYRADGRCLLTNQAFRDLFGSEPPPEYNVLKDEIAAERGILGLIHRAFAGETVSTPPIWYDPRELKQVKVTVGKRVAMSSTFFPIHDRAGRVAYVAIVFRDVTREMQAQEVLEARRLEAEAAARRTRFIAEASALLSSSLDEDATARAFVRHLVPVLGHVCTLVRIHENGAIERLAEAHDDIDPAALAHLRAVPVPPLIREELRAIVAAGTLRQFDDYAAWVASRVGRDATYHEAVAALGLGSTIVAPLVTRGRGVGILSISTLRASGRRHTPEDVLSLHELSRHAALALENARLFTAKAEAEERARLAMEAAAIGICDHDVATGALRWDERSKALFGIAPEETVTDERVIAAIHPDDRARTIEARAAALSGGGTYENEYRVIAGGRERWIRAKGKAFFGPEGKAVRLLVTVQDVSARKRAEEEQQRERERAEAANRSKDEFLAMLGHELRNPLSPILTALGVLRLRGERAFVNERTVIERQVAHMVRLVDDLLDISRIKRGMVELRKRRVEIAEVVSKGVEIASPLLEQRSHRLVVEVPASGLAVHGDEHRLAQVLANLLTNAAKYTRAGGTITVTARAAAGSVVLAVRDTGRGIDAGLLPRVFDVFVQGGSQKLDRSEGGLGLGLAIVKSIVQLHGGTVEASSAGLERGSEFRVSLPAIAAEEEPPTAGREVAALEPVRAAPPSVTKRVLVVDDNRDAALTLAELLELSGFEVRTAFDGPSALAVGPELGPEVALVDIGLPVMDGYELARRLRAEPWGKAVKLVAITGYGQEQDRARSKAAGFDRHLVKPVDVDELLALLGESV